MLPLPLLTRPSTSTMPDACCSSTLPEPLALTAPFSVRSPAPDCSTMLPLAPLVVMPSCATSVMGDVAPVMPTCCTVTLTLSVVAATVSSR